jgi:hypothetical protein
MKTIIRRYSGEGAKELFDVLEKHTADVEKLMRSVKGFVSYTLARSGKGGFSVTVCRTKAGIDESIEKAQGWIAKHAGIADGDAVALKVSRGAVIVHAK